MMCFGKSLAAIAVASIVTLVGCSGEDGPEILPVTGVVTLDGQPLPDAKVLFQPRGGRGSVATTGPDGKYELLYKTGVHGAIPGKHRVFISTASEGGEGVEGGDGAEASEPTPETLPGRYNVNSNLSAEVTEDQTEYDFALTSNLDDA